MRDQTSYELKEQELVDALTKAETEWNEAKTLEDKRRALDQVNAALSEIEKFNEQPKALKDMEEVWLRNYLSERGKSRSYMEGEID